MENQQDFFSYAAEVGITKHPGGNEATDKLAALCHIDKDMTILDVGCGVGITPCYLAKKYGCNVVGIDILEKMVARSNEFANQEGLQDRVKFKAADAHNLPFDDNSFDAVITESVTAFTGDKQKAIHEYVRVTKPGGFIGLNESTWLEYPPPPDIVAWVSQDAGEDTSLLTSVEWESLLKAENFKNISSEVHKIDIKDESRGIVRRYGWRRAFSIFWNMIRLYQKNPSYREFVRRVQSRGITPSNLNQYYGYGLYVGQK